MASKTTQNFYKSELRKSQARTQNETTTMDNSERSPVPIKLRDMLSKGLTEFRTDEPRLDTSFQMAKLVRVDSAAPMRRRK